jgi:hypothetical protein
MQKYLSQCGSSLDSNGVKNPSVPEFAWLIVCAITLSFTGQIAADYEKRIRKNCTVANTGDLPIRKPREKFQNEDDLRFR